MNDDVVSPDVASPDAVIASDVAVPAVAEGDLLDDRYRVLKRLGAGGTASVWRANDELLGRAVAVKVLDHRAAGDEQSRSRLYDEAKILARLSHPRVASVYDYGLVGGIPYLVMELVEGVTMSALLRRDGGVPWGLAVRICAQVAEALDAAHGCGLVHRDISPANILWTRSGVKVIDFGLCATAGDPEETDGLHGTPAYMAPERIEGEPVRAASDVYALGVVLYRALARRLPWPAESVMQLLGAHRNLPPRPLDAEGVPAPVADVCERCLAKDPAQRPSAAEVATVLAAALDPRDEPARDEPTIVDLGLRTVMIHRSRLRVPRPVALAASALGLVAMTGLATTWLTHSTPQTTAADQITAGEAACHVDYRLTQDTGDRFTAAITVHNTSDKAYDRWHLVFGLPGDQSVDPDRAPGWTEDNRVVTSPAQPGQLNPGAQVPLSFAGRYGGTNPFPTAFLLDDHRCSASLLALSGAPVVPITVVAPQQNSGDQQPGRPGREEDGGKGHGHGKAKN